MENSIKSICEAVFILFFLFPFQIYAQTEVQKINDLSIETNLNSNSNHSWQISFEEVDILQSTKLSLENLPDPINWQEIKTPSNAFQFLPKSLKEEKKISVEHLDYIISFLTFSEPKDIQTKLITTYYKKEIILPRKIEKNIAIRVGRITDKDETYFNGIRIGQTGEMDNDDIPQSYDRIRIYEVPLDILLPGKKNVILVKTRNYIANEIGIIGDYTSIAPQSKIISSFYKDEVVNLMLLVGYLTVGTYFLFLFFNKVYDYSYLLFGIFSFDLVVYQFLRNQFKYELFESFFILKKIEYLSLIILCPSIIHFARILLKFKYNLFNKFLDSLMAVLFLFILFHPSVRIYNYINFNFIFFLLIIYILIVSFYVIRRLIQKNKEAQTVILGGIFLMLTGASDIISVKLYLNIPGLVKYGFAIFIFNLARVLANRYVKLNLERDDFLLKAELRTKEISCLYSISQIFSKSGKSTKSKMFNEIVQIISHNWPYSSSPNVELIIESEEYKNYSQLNNEYFLTVPIQIEKSDNNFLRVANKNKFESEGKFKNDSFNFLKTIGNLIENIISKMKVDDEVILANAVFENAIEGVLVTDASGSIQYINPAFSAMTGYLPSEAIGKKPNFLKSGLFEKDFYKKLWNQLYENKKWHGEIWNRKKNGEVFPLLLSITGVYDSDGDIIQFVAIYSDITDLKNNEEKIKYQAHHDALTGLPNRILFNEKLMDNINYAKRYKNRFCILFFDLDNFKHVNDTLGHNAGDQLINLVANKVKLCIGKGDTIARLSGDEFIILLKDISTTEKAIELCKTILAKFKEDFIILEREVNISASLGITFFPDDGLDVETLVMNADIAMYRAKDLGKNSFQIYTNEMKETINRRLHLENELRKAISRDELSLVYQPIFSFDKNKFIGVEALIRWSNKSLGSVSPLEFIPIAEDSKLIFELGEWVLNKASSDISELQQKGFPDFCVSVNVSAKQFEKETLVGVIEDVLGRIQLPAECLILEITESAIMENVEKNIEVMKTLKSKGIKIVIDDFGTGHSSLNYLMKFPISKLKLDRSFIIDFGEKPEVKQVIGGTIALAHSLGLKVTMEGVDTKEQIDYLITKDCNEIQGYYYSKPLSIDDLEKFLKSK